jgi:predicted GNAT family N-acyltransferase
MAPSEPSRTIRVEQVRDGGELASALAIREVVFIEEQHVPPSLEHDADDALAFHVLAYDGKHAVGTGRLVPLAQPPAGEAGAWGRVGRMAVLAAHRRCKVGTQILGALEAEARRRGFAGIVLHAQLHAREFYRMAGYAASGPIFEEAGMPHVEMLKRLRVAPS